VRRESHGQVGRKTGALRPITCDVSNPAGSLSLCPYANATRWRPCWSKGIGGMRWLHETSFVVQRVRSPPGQG
jgi:hypothetical protein